MKLYLVCLTTLSLALTACVSAEKHDQLQADYDALKKSHVETQVKLEASETNLKEQNLLVTELTNKLGNTSSDKKKLQSSIEEMKTALAEMSQRRKAAEKAVQDYENLVSKFKRMTDAGQLNVKVVDGRMVLALNSDILFPSGSSRLSPEGAASLAEVSKVLATIPDKQFQIEGHTDNLPIATKVFPSNWELASARAVRVVKTMTEAGMPPERISAASFGEFRPVAANETPEGKAANRRIEIVIVPDLSLLPGFNELKEKDVSTATPSPSATPAPTASPDPSSEGDK